MFDEYEEKKSFDFSILYVRYVSHRSVRSIVRLSKPVLRSLISNYEVSRVSMCKS